MDDPDDVDRNSVPSNDNTSQQGAGRFGIGIQIDFAQWMLFALPLSIYILVSFFKEIAASGLTSDECPIVSYSLSEDEFRSLPTKDLVGHLGCWTYFMSLDTPENDEFIEAWLEFIGDENRVTNDPMEAHYIGFNMWVKAVEAAGTIDPDAVIDSIVGVAVPNLSGGMSAMMPNHHITKPVLIGEIQDDGQFEVVWSTSGLVVGDEWSDYLEDSKDLIADWRAPMSCGNFNVASGKCGGQGKSQ